MCIRDRIFSEPTSLRTTSNSLFSSAAAAPPAGAAPPTAATATGAAALTPNSSSIALTLSLIHISGGNVDRVIDALIAGQKAAIALDFKKATAIDLAGRDVLQAVRMSVNPKVIETPVVAAIAKDGDVYKRQTP